MTECVLEDRDALLEALGPHYGGSAALERILRAVARPPAMTVVRCQGCFYAPSDKRHVSLDELERRLCAALGSECAARFVFVPRLCGLPDVLGIVAKPTPHTTEPESACGTALPAVVVDVRCGEAVLRGAHVFAPGVVTCERGVVPGSRVALFADERGALQRGAIVTNTAASLPAERFVLLGTGTARMGRAELFDASAKRPSGVAVEVCHTVCAAMPPLNGVAEDCAVLQNLPSVLAGHALAPEPGMRVLDMCAAPGGKTSHLAALMRDTGELVALDRRQARVDELARLVERLQLSCVRVAKADATALGSMFSSASFDRVLLDAPCSGLGLRPRLHEACKAAELPGRAMYQRKLLREAVRLLKPGGVLVYSVCTMNPGEGEDTVAFALRELAPAHNLVLVDAFGHLPHLAGIGQPGLAGTELDSSLCALVRRFTPPPQSSEEMPAQEAYRDWPAFFLAKFIKREEQ